MHYRHKRSSEASNPDAIIETDRQGAPLKIEVLREFLYLSEELNFSKTAKHFFISQSVLSRHVQDLENELGCTLFLRNNSSVRLTTMGKYLADSARELVTLHDAIIDGVKCEVENLNASLNVGYLKGASGWFLNGACKLFRRERPDTTISVRSLQPDEILEGIKRDELDLGVTIWPKERSSSILNFSPICQDRFVLMMSKDNALASYDEVPPQLLEGTLHIPESFPHESDLGEMLRSRLKKAGVDYIASRMIDDIDSMPLLFEHRDWTMTSCEHLQRQFGSDFKHVPIKGVDLSYEIGAVWKKSHDCDALEAFVDCLQCSYEMLSQA